jgi:pimeloyl-ACP methyl ester carboxylesterase
VDLATQATHLEVPVWFVEGRHDLNSFPQLAEDYLKMLDAPSKQLVWFEHSGHNPMHEEAGAFNDFMLNTVLAATSAG